MKILLASLFALVSLAGLSAFVPTQDKPAADDSKAQAEKILAQKGAYPLKVCPVSGEKLDAKAVDVLIDERLVRVCCEKCVEPAKKDKETIFKGIERGVIEQQLAGYPLDTCLISGEKLDESAKLHVQGTYLMKLCCGDCVAQVKKNPAPELEKLKAAYIAKQAADYPLNTCAVTGEPLGSMGDPLDYLWGTRMYRLCCGGCKKAVQKNADELWKKLETARAEKKK